MPDSTASLLRLILWPSILTLLVSVARLLVQLKGMGTTASGGGGFWLGITWLVFVFGGWFGWQLGRAGSTPRLRPAWLWSLFALLAIVGTVMWRFHDVDPTDTSETAMTALRSSVLILAAVATVMALCQFVVWPKLAGALLLYAVGARITVMGIAWLAKHQGWDTHYTKFGPAGIERDMAGTMQSVTISQLGFWVPFTIVAGTLVGAIIGGRRVRDPQSRSSQAS